MFDIIFLLIACIKTPCTFINYDLTIDYKVNLPDSLILEPKTGRGPGGRATATY